MQNESSEPVPVMQMFLWHHILYFLIVLMQENASQPVLGRDFNCSLITLLTGQNLDREEELFQEEQKSTKQN